MIILDSLIIDDEPLWEPLEWSLVQIWLLWIFIFAWIGENLIASRFGHYTGRDKRVWLAWYKSFWGITVWYQLSFGAAALFVIVPFYYEITYQIAFIVSWWDWYSRIFFFHLIGLLSLGLVYSQYCLIMSRFWSWEKILGGSLVILILLSFLFYGSFIAAFFSYFTDPLWYQKTRFIDTIQQSYEPLKWGWGGAKRDHFTYHNVSTVFWFKTDNPFAGAFFLFQWFMVLILFFILLFWIVLIRRIYTTHEVSITYFSYCVSSLRQFSVMCLSLYILIGVSYLMTYWRFPVEFLFLMNGGSWWGHLGEVVIAGIWLCFDVLMGVNMVFIKASKVMALGFVFLPLTGCAVATGLVFAALIRGVSYAPDLEEVMFNYTALGFAFIESFSFLLFFIAALIMVL